MEERVVLHWVCWWWLQKGPEPWTEIPGGSRVCSMCSVQPCPALPRARPCNAAVPVPSRAVYTHITRDGLSALTLPLPVFPKPAVDAPLEPFPLEQG